MLRNAWRPLVFVFLAAGISAPPASADEQATVTLLHTTDLHGHLLPEEDFTNAPAPRGLARVATLIKQERATDPDLLLLDAGDCIQGTPLELVHHRSFADRPDPMMTAMNLMDYDAMAVGNHEYDFGWKTLDDAREAARFPWLSANTLKDGQPEFEPYRVFVVHGVRVGVLGLTTPAVPVWSEPEKYPDLTFADAVETCRKWVPILRDKEGCDVVVVLAHQGLERDVASGHTYEGQEERENACFAIAQNVPGVDAIIMGHTHRVVPGLTVNGVLLTQAGRWGENLGKLELRFSRPSARDHWKLDSKRGQILPVGKDTAPDSAIVAVAAPFQSAITAYLDEPLGTAGGDFDAMRGRSEDCSLLDLIHAAQLEAGEADVSLAAAFGSGARLAAGPVRMRDIASVYVYENTLYTLEVTGRELRQALEQSARYYNPYDFGKSDRPLVNPDIPGYNFDTAAGVEYTLDLTQAPGHRVRDLRFHGQPLEDDRVLRVAVNSYRRNGGGGFQMFRGAKVVKKSSEGVREILAGYIRRAGTIKPSVDGNWRIVPALAFHPAHGVFERLVRHGVWSEDGARALDPEAPLSRAQFADWLGRAFPGDARSRSKPRFSDVPTEWSQAVERAARAGAFAGTKGSALHPLEPLDLWSAVDWTVYAAGGGSPSRPSGSGSAFDPAPLRLSTAPPLYGRPRLPAPVERAALAQGFLDEWDEKANPLSLTCADGARLLAAARYPWITVLSTTDFHGAFQRQDRDRETGRRLGSTPVFAATVLGERARNPRGTVLLDDGDLMQGTMLSNLEFGRPVIEQMNRLGYDATAVGNHEFDWSVDTLRARIRQARFPFLAANFFKKGGSSIPDWVRPYALFERHGVGVGALGFCTVETPLVTLPVNVASYEFRPEAPIARKWIPEMRKKGASVVVIMGHLPASQDSARVIHGELADVGHAVEGEDALLGGHSHNFVDGEVDGVPTLIAASHARAVGRLDFVVDRKTGRVVEREGRLVYADADAVTPDPGFTAFVDSLALAIEPIAGRKLCDAPEPLTRGRRGESAIGNWVADVMRAKEGADVALQNPGGLRADIDAGPVTVQDVYEVMPFDNRIAVVKLTGAQLLDALENGVRGGVVQVSGLRYVFDPSRPAGERIVKVEMTGGAPLDPKATYLVATNDFMAQGGDGFDVFAKGKDLRVTSDLVRDALVADCEARGRKGQPHVVALDGRIQSATSQTARTGSRAPAGSGSNSR